MVYSHPALSQQQKSDMNSNLSNGIVNVKMLIPYFMMFMLKGSKKTVKYQSILHTESTGWYCWKSY
jgi:hypothetical protein